MEIWLRPNRRALLLGTILPGMGLLVGVLLLWISRGAESPWAYVGMALGAILVALSGLVSAALLWALRLPRIARSGNEVWFYLAGARPIRVPLDAVEAFLSGKAPSVVGRHRTAETAAVVVRIADRYRDFHDLPVKPSLGTWSGGYVSIRGTWCEPISIDLIKSLNRRLSQAKRERREESPA